MTRLVSLRAVTGLGVVLASGAVVVAGYHFPQRPLKAVSGITVAVAPPPQTLVCPGPLQLPDIGSGDPEFSRVPVQPETVVGVVGSQTVAVTGLGGGVLNQVPSAGGGIVLDISAAAVLRAEGSDRIAGSTVSTVTDGDLRGLSAASCQKPAADFWFVGGSTDLGSEALLVLTNPGSASVQVTWSAWSTIGPVDLVTNQTMVAPQSTKAVNLAGPAGEHRALVVHIQVNGGRVSAVIQGEHLDGYTPIGTDLVVPGAPPARRQIVSGLLLEQSMVGETGQPVLRLLAPDIGTTAVVTVLGGEGTIEVPGAESITLNAGEVTEVPLGGIAPGRAAVVIDASEPIVASVEYGRIGSPGDLDPVPRVDNAVAAAGQSGGGMIAVPPGLLATLVVSAVGRDAPTTGAPGAADLEVLGQDGQILATHSMSIDAGTTGAWALDDLVSSQDQIFGLRVVDPAGSPLVWSVVVEHEGIDGTLISVLQPIRNLDATEAVTVRADPALLLP